MTLKVALVNPPVLGVLEPWYDTPEFGRTGLAYLAGYLRQFPGFEILILDAKFLRLDFMATLEKLIAFAPDVVGLTAFTNEIKPAAYMAYKIKQKLPGVTTIIGGVHVTALPEATLREFPHFDVGVVGEGEITFHEICERLKNGNEITAIPGTVFRKDEEIVLSLPRERILDQDSIPFPAWDLMPPAATYFVQSLRGCPFNCVFCMNPNGRVARQRSVSNVIEELEWIIRDFTPKRISFGDELFSVDMERTHRLLDAMIEAKIGERVQWDVQTHVRFVDDALFAKMKRAGISRVELGIETGDEDKLRTMGKGTNLLMIEKARKSARKEKVKIGTFFLLGQPDETRESLKRTLKLAVKINPDLPMFGLMTPYPGTEVSKLAAEGKAGYKLLTTDWDEYNKQIGGALEFAGMSRNQIEWFQVKAYLAIFIRNFRILDLFAFLWEYRKGALSVLKKKISGKSSIASMLQKPVDYNDAFSLNYQPELRDFFKARTDWNNTQKSELKRVKGSEVAG